MEIKYLKVVEENKTINDFTNEPMSLDEIEKLEAKYNNGKEFPLAFREFLFLAGEFNNFNFDDLGDGMDELQDLINEELVEAGQEVDRPFFAFSVYDSQYSVIFLDDNNEDPKVYVISPYLAKGNLTPLVKIPTGGFKEEYTFVELVNESIRRRVNNLGI